MTVAHETLPSDKKDAQIPNQNTREAKPLGKVISLLIPTQEQYEPKRQFDIDPDLFLAKANAIGPSGEVLGSNLLLIVLEEEGIVPPQQQIALGTIRLEALEKAHELMHQKHTARRDEKFAELKRTAGVIGDVSPELIEQARAQEAQARARREEIIADLQLLQRGFDEAYLKRDASGALIQRIDLDKNFDLIQMTQAFVESDDLLRFSQSVSNAASDEKRAHHCSYLR